MGVKEIQATRTYTLAHFDDDLGGRLGRREAAFCFVWAQPFVADEIKRQTKLLHLDFEGFLEAVCRLTCFKPMPTPGAARRSSHS